jgi:signal transduction histidine kinase
MNEELRSFSWHLQHISEIEKNKLAIEMHNELGQGLIALKMEVAQLKKHLFEDPSLLVFKSG